MTDEVKTEPKWMANVRNVGTNVADIPWVSDQWGLTTELKAAIVKMANRQAGNAQKSEIMIANLMIGLRFIQLRSERDQAQRRQAS